MASRSAPSGYRFHPTDEELVNYYLRQKMQGYDQQVHRIAELNVYDYMPWELPDHSAMQSDDRVWYFFCPRASKYSNNQRMSRTTTAGYWKVTCKDRKVKTEDGRKEIGVRRTLTFYKGRTPHGTKTGWLMYEYNPTFELPNQRNYVLYKLKSDEDDVPTNYKDGGSSSQMPSNYSENQSQYQNNSYEEGIEMQAYLDSFRGYGAMDYSPNAAFPSNMQSSSYGGYGGTTHGYDSTAPMHDPFYGFGNPYHYN